MNPLNDIIFQQRYFEELRKQTMKSCAVQIYIHAIMAFVWLAIALLSMIYFVSTGNMSIIVIFVGLYLFFDQNGFSALWSCLFKSENLENRKILLASMLDVYSALLLLLGIAENVVYVRDVGNPVMLLAPFVFIVFLGLAFASKNNANSYRDNIMALEQMSFNEQNVTLTKGANNTFIVDINTTQKGD